MKENKIPRVIAGAFIFNDKDELLLIKGIKSNNKYICPGGGVEFDEKIEDAVRREIKEETGLEIEDIEFLTVVDGVKQGSSYQGASDHLIFLDHKAKAKGKIDVKLNKEASEYHWDTPEKWLKRKDLEKYTRWTIENFLIDNEDYQTKYTRALADYQNLLKRTANEKTEFAKYANEQLLYEMIPVYDNLKTAITHSNSDNNDNWLDGVKYVVKQFKEILSGLGVREIKTTGEKFDHNTMEAVDNEVIKDKKKDDMVAKEIKAGYILNDKVIIPAKVVVYKFKK